MITMRRLLKDDRGFTLPELLVTIMLMTILGIIISQVLASTLVATRALDGAARSNDEARLAIQQIDRELRGAEYLCEPQPGLSSDRLEFRTRAYASDLPPSGYQDLIYELQDLDGDGTPTTLRRSGDGGLTWRTIVSDVVNAQVATDTGVDQYIFVSQGQDEVSSSGATLASPSFGKVITITVWIDTDPGDAISPRLLTTEITGRNIWTPNSPNC